MTLLFLFSLVINWFPVCSFASGDPVLVGAGDIAECWLGFFNGTYVPRPRSRYLITSAAQYSPSVITLIVKGPGILLLLLATFTVLPFD